ncbi:DUF2793 domain-containing protein [Solimonas fluminis]|nr:DUF2793 domain-containing protein [Solimonas fluminis]
MVQIGTFFSGVLSASVTDPPSEPVNGNAYLVPDDATGVWTGMDQKIALYFFGYRFIDPFPGVLIYVADLGQWWTYNGSSWGAYNPGAGVIGPGSSVSGNIPAFNGTGGDSLQDSGKAFSTDGTLSSDSDDKIPTEKAVKTYVDALVAAQDSMVFKGAIDCSANPNYPAADAGHVYKVSVAGKIGGASGPNVQAGDTLYCITDSSASGDHATVGANWVIVQVNIDGAVIGPASSTDGGLALFDGTTGKLVKGDGLTVSNDDFLQRKAGAWANRTPAQVAADLQALIQAPRIQAVTSSATVTPTFSDDMVKITAQAAALALANPTGTAVPGAGLVIRIKDNGTARAISYDTQYRAIGVTLPTTTVINKTLYLGCIWNADDTKLDVVAVAQEA